jgi:hypothetical protein
VTPPREDRRAAYVQALRARLREDREATVEDHVALELIEQILPYTSGEHEPPAALTARLFRFYTETGDLELAREHRARLHLFAEAGDRLAAEVLALLSDDPFWREG